MSLISHASVAAGVTVGALGTSLAYLFHKHPETKYDLRLLYKKLCLGHTIPVSVNYHFTRHCNADCGFCFHTETTSHKEPFETASVALRLLHNEGMKKINFAGGEPFLYPKPLGKMCQFAKQELRLPSVSIVSNGTRVTEAWLRKWGAYVDILAISCDSFNPDTNSKIGRKERNGGKPFNNVKQLFQIRDWCRELGIKFKLNTVVCNLNWDEDMVETVKELAPFRWKVFQVLVVHGENESDKRKRDARKFAVTGEQFDIFCEKHKSVEGFTPENNKTMRASYLILDEYLRFLDAGESKEITSGSILDIGVQRALKQVHWDRESFKERGGVYEWSKNCGGALSGIDAKGLEF